MLKEELKPFIITDENGGIADMLMTNEKGYKKSLENSCIWAVDMKTGRLLPSAEKFSIISFREGPGWYQAVTASAGGTEKKNPAPAPSGPSGSSAGPDTGSGIIERLYEVISERKNELPEGSYTTHLFNSGLSKIRKKAGEEAVELLLAESRDEVIYEAADLIYHMLVLLAALDITPGEIFAELESRE